MKITAVGDFLIQQPYQAGYPGFQTIKDYIGKGDARFVNLETTLHKEGSCPAGAFSGGSYLRSDPEALDTTLAYGFNLLSNNNNHAFDFGTEGFLSTLELIERSGVAHAGTGLDLPSAAKPAYVDTPDGKAALISVCASFTPPSPAGNPSRHYPGRPGLNPLRYSQTIRVTREQGEVLRRIADETGVNRTTQILRREGYAPALPDGVIEFSDLRLKVSDQPGVENAFHAADYKRIMNSIEEAKKCAAYVILSLHNHCITGEKEEVPPFLRTFCHDAIDHGVGAVVCHGPHLLRGLELYKGCPIFHSLGDFVLQLGSIQSAPADFYENVGVDVNLDIKELLRVRSDNGKRGLMYDRKMFETVIPYWEVENGKMTCLEMLPVELGFDEEEERRGIPLPAKDLSFVQRFAALSAEFGTKMELKDGIVKVLLD